MVEGCPLFDNLENRVITSLSVLIVETDAPTAGRVAKQGRRVRQFSYERLFRTYNGLPLHGRHR